MWLHTETAFPFCLLPEEQFEGDGCSCSQIFLILFLEKTECLSSLVQLPLLSKCNSRPSWAVASEDKLGTPKQGHSFNYDLLLRVVVYSHTATGFEFKAALLPNCKVHCLCFQACNRDTAIQRHQWDFWCCCWIPLIHMLLSLLTDWGVCMDYPGFDQKVTIEL